MIYDMKTYDDYDYITKMTSNRLDILIYSRSQSVFQMVFVEIPISTKTIQGDAPKWSPAKCWLVQWYPPLTWHSLTSYSQWNQKKKTWNWEWSISDCQTMPKPNASCLDPCPTMSGWWYTYPSEKYESQLGWWHSQYMEKWNSCSKPTTRIWLNHVKS